MDKRWVIKKLKDLKLKNPVMIEGLPGMGNVGKITIDFIIYSKQILFMLLILQFLN